MARISAKDTAPTADPTLKAAVAAKPKDKVSQMVQFSIPFMAALREFAKEQKETVTVTVRRAVAHQIGYTLTAADLTTRGPQKKYATKEERTAAIAAEGKKKRELTKKLMEFFKTNANPELMALLSQSGIELE
jgi:hypothetical protein